MRKSDMITNDEVIELMTELGYDRGAICGYYGRYDGHRCCRSFIPKDSDDAPWNEFGGLSTNDLRIYANAVLMRAVQGD